MEQETQNNKKYIENKKKKEPEKEINLEKEKEKEKEREREIQNDQRNLKIKKKNKTKKQREKTDQNDSRISYILKLRKEWMDPKTVNEDLSINKEYFLPTMSKIRFVQEKQKKNSEKINQNTLIQGILKFGVGKWEQISQHFFSNNQTYERLRIETRKLFQRDSILEYEQIFWKPENMDLLNKEIQAIRNVINENPKYSTYSYLLEEDRSGYILKKIYESRKKISPKLYQTFYKSYPSVPYLLEIKNDGQEEQKKNVIQNARNKKRKSLFLEH
ncbi:hypothetical protein M0813_04601 [Anaeramoeba flamelloides]|uniref:Uncharacterized protein n=1 Tax=Anaeramoeba flamelloides TaxID=1746091 RepID=A0ABQ8XJZ5_9EUKA|nr:hypothetical protein M0813_04601 [Anaeramoeba flamelloides]